MILQIILFITGLTLGVVSTFFCFFLYKRYWKRNVAEYEADEIDIAVEFEGKTAEEVAVHRKDIFALPRDAKWSEIIHMLVKGNYSRIPVYNESIDNIEGIFHSKDLLNALLANPQIANCIDNSSMNINEMLRKPYFVPFNKKLETIYTKMKSGREHLAVIVDEYGGTAGLLTIEDIIEEILGDIYDEYDEKIDHAPITLLYDKVYVAQGKTQLDKIAEYFKVELPTDEYDTLSGFIVGQLGRIPVDGEQPSFEYQGLIFKIYDIYEMRVLHAFIYVIEQSNF